MTGKLLVPRACTVLGEAGDREAGERRPLSEFRGRDAYVLLGAPGAGKTTAFEQEARAADGCYVTARDFVTLGDRDEWGGQTLYIDGLDERRAGSPDRTTALDGIRRELDRLGRPRFRLSCREADWFGALDRLSLTSVAPTGAVDVLRLDPLTDDDVSRILRENLDVEDAEAFIETAQAHGVDAWLRNPHTLEMLARSVRSGSDGSKWPATRTETFERGCRALAREPNKQHRLVKPPRLSGNQVLDVAGRVCAVLLLTGESGYVEDPEAEGGLSLLDVESPDADTVRTVCATSLFDWRDGFVTPVHRHVAEFLGGRYLATVVKEGGLPVRRVLALSTGFDGGVVSELRGLAAWFAAFSPEARAELVERDPLGVVLYGDVKGFPRADKEAVIRGLKEIAARDPASLTRYTEMDARWGDLATEDMAPVFAEALASANESDAAEALAIALLESLARGSPVPDMAPRLMEAARDEGRSLAMRELSIEAFLRQSADARSKVDLAEDILGEKVKDPRSHLLGKLLWDLYPRELAPEVVAKFFLQSKSSPAANSFDGFWLNRVPDVSTDEQFERVMDELVVSGSCPAAVPYARDTSAAPYLVRVVPERLLWELLKRERLDVTRLFDWLSRIEPLRRSQGVRRIGEWFGAHPDTFKAVFRRSAEREDPERLGSVGLRLMDWVGRPPAGFGGWCVREAASALDEMVARRFVAVAARHLGDEPKWAEIARHLVDRRQLADLVRRRWEEHQGAVAQINRDVPPPVADWVERHRAEWREVVRAEAPALEGNRGNARLLHKLAEVYFDRVSDVDGETPRERLLDLLGADALVNVVLRAFAATADRDDLPTERAVHRGAAAGREFHLSLPFMAGLEEEGAAPVDDARLRVALAIHFDHAVGYEEPVWYAAVVARHPELVAEVLVRAARWGLRGSREVAPDLGRLEAADHWIVAELAVPALLQAFPTRATSRRLPLLKTLLHVALVRCPTRAMDLVRSKLGAASMDVGQRMYWLCAGLLTGDRGFVPRLQEALAAGGEQRVRHVASFFTGRGWSGSLIGKLGVKSLEVLVGSVGRSYGAVHVRLLRPHIATAGMEAEAAVRHWIGRLQSLPGADAAQVLERLEGIEELSSWKRELRRARTAQREVRRNAEFRHAGMEEVLETLDAQGPANTGDPGLLTSQSGKGHTLRGRAGMSGSSYYQVALSFAGEQRPYVEEVARNLQARGVSVFYDDFESVRLWGRNAAEAFHDVFARRSAYVVMFISSEYVAKAWPRHERRSAISRMIHDEGEYVLPVRFDDTPVPGLPEDLLYLEAEDHKAAELAVRIAEKVGIEPFDGKASEVPPPRMTSLVGETVFDYSGYNGRYVIGGGETEFETAWSKASDASIHLYNDPPSINGVAVPGVTSIAQVRKASALDYTSRVRAVPLGGVAVLRNRHGFYACLRVLEILDGSRGDDRDELRFRYAVQRDGSDDFGEFGDLDG